MTTQQFTKKMTPVFKDQGVIKAAIFGSFARGEEKKNSDIDILVKLPTGKSLLDLIKLELDLEDILGRKVDILPYNSVHPVLRKIIFKEQKIIYF